MKVLQPPGWTTPKGYSNGIAARGTLIVVGGQIGWNAQQQFESDDFVAQARTALANVVAVLAEAGARPEHIVRMTWYVTDKREYIASYRALGAAYRDVIGRHFPAMTAVEVKSLIEDRAKVEIEATAVVPDSPSGTAAVASGLGLTCGLGMSRMKWPG
jgi:enamine deaminase RidA (YjgF/YER057c/UK114 family)